MHFQVKRTPIDGMFELGEIEHKWPNNVEYTTANYKMENEVLQFGDNKDILNIIQFTNTTIIKRVSTLNPNAYFWHVDSFYGDYTHLIICICSEDEDEADGTYFTKSDKRDSFLTNMIGKLYHVYLIPRTIYHMSPLSSSPRFMHRYCVKLADEQIRLLESVK
jgi:hypothetical protein